MSIKESLLNAQDFFSTPTPKAENTSKNEIVSINKNDLIKLFVSFYGEEHREFITAEINSVKIIFASQMTDENLKSFDIDDKMRPSFEEELKEFALPSSDAQAYCKGYLDRSGNFQKCLVLSGNFNDHQLIHELNHILEMRFVEKSENGFKYFTGFDKIEENFDEKETQKSREFTKINEVVNESITMKIMQKKNELGIKISPKKFLFGGYLWGVKVSQKFIDYFMPDLIECRIAGKPEKFIELIGKDNFEKLSNDLKVIMNIEDLEINLIKNEIEEKTGKKLQNASDLLNYSEYFSQLDIKEDYKRFFEALTDYKEISKFIIEQDRENEYF